MGSVIGQRWEVYDYRPEDVKNRVPKKGEETAVNNTPLLGSAALKLIGDGTKTVMELYEEWDARYVRPEDFAGLKNKTENLADYTETAIENLADHTDTAIENLTDHTDTAIENLTDHTDTAIENLTGHTDTAIENLQKQIQMLSPEGQNEHAVSPVLDHPDGSVTEPKLQDKSVTTPKLQDKAVTAPKIADEAVGVDQLTPSERLAYLPGTLTIDTFEGGPLTMGNLQPVINSLPKHLRQNVTINVSPGTTSGDITIERFYGPGSLSISRTGPTSSLTCNRVVCRYNAAAITLSYFIGSTGTNSSFYFSMNSHVITLNNSGATSGATSTEANIGVDCVSNPGIVYVKDFTSVYQRYGVRCSNGLLKISGLNLAAYPNIGCRAENGGIIQMIDNITGINLSSANQYSRATGGVIFLPNGMLQGMPA